MDWFSIHINPYSCRFRYCFDVVDDWKRWRGSRRDPNELLEEANVKDVVQAGVGWKIEVDNDVIDELDDAVGTIEVRLELPFG